MIPLHLARIRGGLAKEPFRCAMLFVQEHADIIKGTSQRWWFLILRRGKGRGSMGLGSDAAIRTIHREMLRAVFGGVRRLPQSKEEKGVQGRLHWRRWCFLHAMAISDIEKLGHRFVGNVTQHSSRTPAAPAPAPAPAPASAPGLATPAVVLPWVSSVMEQRRLVRLAAAGHGSSSYGNRGGYNLWHTTSPFNRN